MALNSAEIVVAGNGNTYAAPVGTVMPVTPTTAPAATWIELGYLSEDGIGLTPEQAVQDFMAWQALFAVRTSVTSRGMTFTLPFLQWNETNLPLALGGGAITGAGPYLYTPPSAGAPYERAFLLRAVDGTKNYQVEIPRAMPVNLASINLNKANMAILAVGFKILQPSSGDPFLIRTDDAAMAA